MMPTFEQLHPRFAARVTDVDLRDDLDDETFEALRQGFAQYSVLVFPDQPLNDEQHIAFSQRLGPLEATKVGSYGAGTPLVILSNVGEDGKVVPEVHKLNLVHKANSLWHSDSSFKPVAALASMLSAKIVPPKGGETEYAGMIAAWEDLPKEMKIKIEDRIAIHHFATSRNNTDKRLMTKAEYNELPPVEHPLVRYIPETGQRALFVGSHAGAIIGMSEAEAKSLINELLEFATRPENVYTHKWSEKDAVLWDNRAVVHRGRPFARDKHARVMIRTTIAGEGSKDIVKAA